MKKLFVIVLVFFSVTMNAQKPNVEILKIGFHTNFGANPTKYIIYVEDLIINEDYEAIKKLIQSENSSKQFIGVVICENLKDLNLVSFSDEYKVRIKEIYESKEKVPILLGCKASNVALKELLNREERHLIRIQVDEWLEKILKTEMVEN